MSHRLEAYVETENDVRYASLVLSAGIIGIYVLEMLFPAAATDFALHVPTFWQEPWTIITSMFLHSTSDYMHLLNNLYFLAIFGFILENTIGTKRFLRLFLAAGIFANLAAFSFYTDSIVWGASGAISGIIAAIAIIKPRSVGLLYGLPVPMWVALIGWVGSNIIQSTEILVLLGATITEPTGGGTAFMAHIYGLAFGIGYGLFIRKRHPHIRDELRRTDEPDKWEWDDADIDIEEWERKHMR
jgi:membrane associated rhomboid family serine protease